MARAPAWRFEGQAANATVKQIAPGLGTIELPKAKSWVTLADDKKHKLVRVRTAKTDASALGAPEVTALDRTQHTGRRGTTVSIEATLKAVPPDALALVVFGVEKSGRVGRSWARVSSSAGLSTGPHASIAIEVYYSGACHVVPVGWTDSHDGDKVELAWLDTSGRLSKSITVTVKGKPEPAGTGPISPGD